MSVQLDAQELDRLRAAADRDEIRTVISTYFLGVDQHDWERVRSCYHDGATEDHGPFNGGVDDFMVWLTSFVPGNYSQTMHVGCQTVIDLDGEQAGSETYAVVYHWSRPGEDGSVIAHASGGRLLDRFERRNGAWRIVHRALELRWVLHLDPVDPSTLPAGAAE